MSDILLPAPPKSVAEYKNAIEQLFREMERIDAHIAQEQQEIDRLKAETQVRLAELKRW